MKIYAGKLAEIVLSNPILSNRNESGTWTPRPFDWMAWAAYKLDIRLKHQLCQRGFGMYEDYSYCRWCERPVEECRYVLTGEVLQSRPDRESNEFCINLCSVDLTPQEPMRRSLGFPFSLGQKFWDVSMELVCWSVGEWLPYERYEWKLSGSLDDEASDAWDERAAKFSGGMISFIGNSVIAGAYRGKFDPDEFERWLLVNEFPFGFVREGYAATDI